MAAFPIPDHLVRAASERRLLPFVGAGFSAAVGLPGWDTLLGRVASRIAHDIDYPALKVACGDDPLRIAEYLYIRADRNIGPLRYHMSMELHTAKEPTRSTPHIELVNLGTPQVYTTNFDNVIEQTFDSLGERIDVVALPKHVALADLEKTQIVKYHGDLQYDETLVLTESSYYTRLDFESPMDVKFRSDLLGRSVLFMGYSFSDINIRVIWFKLTGMMKEIPHEERPTSYIVRLQPNEPLEALYKSVGLQTIVLDPECKAMSPVQQAELLGDFLEQLATLASPSGTIPGQKAAMFVSPGLLQRATEHLQQMSDRPRRLSRLPQILPSVDQLALRQLGMRRLPAALADTAEALLQQMARTIGVGLLSAARVPLALSVLTHLGPRQSVTANVSLALIRPGGWPREAQMDLIPWPSIWSQKIDAETAGLIFRAVRQDLSFHSEDADESELDFDLAFGVDLLCRIINGWGPDDPDDLQIARDLLADIVEIYPAAAGYDPPELAPKVSHIMDAIRESADSRGQEEIEVDEDYEPF